MILLEEAPLLQPETFFQLYNSHQAVSFFAEKVDTLSLLEVFGLFQGPGEGLFDIDTGHKVAF